MSKSNIQETAYLKLIFQNIAMANVGDASGIQPSAAAGSLYVALYTTDPSDTDSGTEANYTGYARVAIPRTILGWDVTDNIASNVSEILFPVSTGISNVITHFGIRTAVTGGDLIGSGSIAGAITIDPGDTPRFGPGLIAVLED